MNSKGIIDVMVQKANLALEKYMNMDQKKVDEIVGKMAQAALENSETLALMAFEETKKGNFKDKISKNIFASKNVFDSIKNEKTVGIINENKSKGVTEIADPLGVIAGVTPVTNPTSTVIFKALICAKTRNPIIFGFHPGARNCCIETAKILRDAAVSAGAPEDLIQWIEEPSIEATSSLMNHPGVAVVLATGGSAMVKSAYSTGKPALGVGPGNVPCYIEKTANVQRACGDILLSKTFDNGMICASEQSVIVDKEISEEFEAAAKKLGFYFLSDSEAKKLSGFIFNEANGKLNVKIVGQSACNIAKMAGITVPENTKILVAKLDEAGPDVPLSAEKLSPILGYFISNDSNEAFKICESILDFGGRGHTAAIHSENSEVIKNFGLRMIAGRIIVNTPSSQGAIGGIYNSNIPSLTLGCGSHGKNSVSSNISIQNLVNIKKIFMRIKNI